MRVSPCCEHLERSILADDEPIAYFPHIRQWGIWFIDGTDSTMRMNYCPFCGSKFPPSLRDLRFDILEDLGFELFDVGIPDELQSDVWWRDYPEKWGVPGT